MISRLYRVTLPDPINPSLPPDEQMPEVIAYWTITEPSEDRFMPRVQELERLGYTVQLIPDWAPCTGVLA